MAAVGQNDEFYQNNVRTLIFHVKDFDSVLDPKPPLDLGPFSLKWTLSKVSTKSGAPSKTPVLEKKSTVVGEITITDAVNGICEVGIQETDTVTFLGGYYQELEVFDALNRPVVVATGSINILLNVDNT